MEGLLLAHPDVADVGVVGMSDDYAGQLPVAFVVLKEPAKQRAQSSDQTKMGVKNGIMKVTVADFARGQILILAFNYSMSLMRKRNTSG